MKKILLILVSFIFIVPMMAEAKPSKKEIEIQDSLKQVRLNNLKKEVDALLRVRLEKADYLEKKEAEHWRAKYKENLLTEEHQSESRGLEARYSKLSTDLGRITEELMATKTATSDFEEKASSEESSLEAFQMQVDLSIQKRLEEVPGDYPLNMEKRLLRLNSAKESLSKKNPNLIRSMQDYLDELLERHSWTYTQDLETRFSLIGSRPDVKVDRLR
ncbi:MAG TPA: MotA/TolQ/ExbB proton channel family protein, partial [Fibrobacteraceae bacterium]|nr:MotA/TolQ/ExbB proton channel family protein [Fibrobacteraceae bacterium]